MMDPAFDDRKTVLFLDDSPERHQELRKNLDAAEEPWACSVRAASRSNVGRFI